MDLDKDPKDPLLLGLEYDLYLTVLALDLDE